MKKISPSDYTIFCEEYFAGDKYKGLRFGQAFFNTFVLKNEYEVANLFYETDTQKAQEIIWNNYIEY